MKINNNKITTWPGRSLFCSVLTNKGDRSKGDSPGQAGCYQKVNNKRGGRSVQR